MPSDRLEGVAASDYSGRSVASAGDVNGDGFGDLIVGAKYSDPNGNQSGASYVVFGIAPTTAVTRTGTNISQTIAGGAQNGMSLSLGRYFGGDALADLASGAPMIAHSVSVSGSGRVVMLQGKSNGLTSQGVNDLEESDVVGTIESNDHFGAALTRSR